jgi:hypothetical protein
MDLIDVLLNGSKGGSRLTTICMEVKMQSNVYEEQRRGRVTAL